MNEVTILNFNQSEVRVLTDENGEPWFVGKDVCERLGYKDTTNAIKLHCRGVAKHHPILDWLGRQQEVRILSEGDVMRLICFCRLPEAEQFERWVFDEVLPSIRKRGSCTIPMTVETMLADPDMAIQLLTNFKQERAKRLLLEAQREEDRPKVEFAEAIEIAKTSIPAGEMAKLIKNSTGYDIGQNRFFRFLRKNEYVHASGAQRNLPTQRSVNAGWMEVREGIRSDKDGAMVITRTPRVTGKGQIYFISLFNQKEDKKPYLL